ncbi:MAG: hypothetical protein ACREDO_02645 [Methyloceanibacter sp.]
MDAPGIELGIVAGLLLAAAGALWLALRPARAEAAPPVIAGRLRKLREAGIS